MTLFVMWKSFCQNPWRWTKRRYLRWFALLYWGYSWLKTSGKERQTAQVQIWRVISGFDHADWVLAMTDLIKPEYWMM